MALLLVLLVISPYVFQNAQSAQNCTACEYRKCPPVIRPCPGSGREAIDPCGCCRHCPKQRGELCGGPDWEYGYCDNSYKCAASNGTGLVDIPNIGVCKELPGYTTPSHYAEDDDEICPEQSGCYRVMGTCDCVTKRTCLADFSMSRYDPLYCEPQYDDPYADHLFHFPCSRSGCDIVDDQCICQHSGCDRTFEFKDGRSCHKVLRARLCANVTCPEEEAVRCPHDSMASVPHTPYGQCCPTIPSQCTCDLQQCNHKCPRGRRKVMVWESDGVPGRCCHRYLCLL
ncbi:cysteine-rich motor neuron 1 protein-like isoform X1 [Dendropsophus ebraccatus]|uniref:cysteine-rich motor neuron 1 protein-like isoform X1 n=1 Tax=Dendropsophus ebraccatus TaxID=150705 RepID=UPI00383100F2